MRGSAAAVATAANDTHLTILGSGGAIEVPTDELRSETPDERRVGRHGGQEDKEEPQPEREEEAHSSLGRCRDRDHHEVREARDRDADRGQLAEQDA